MQIGQNIYKAVIWDWNGTLLNDTDICIKGINTLLKDRNLNSLSKEVYRDIFTFPVKDYYEMAGFDFSKEEFEVPAIEFIKQYHELLPTASLFEMARPVLSKLKKLGVKQYVLSAMEHKSLVKSLKENRIHDYFVDINGIDNHYAHSKLEIGIEMLKNVPFKKEEILLIGDTLHDKDVASGLGVNCILIANGHQSKKRLLKQTDAVLNDLGNLFNYL